MTTNTKILQLSCGSPLRFILNENGKELNGPLLDDVGPGNGGKGPQLNPAGTGRAVDGAPGDLLGLGAGVCCLLPDSRSRCACECVGVGDSGDSVLVTSNAGRLHFGVSIELPGVELLRLNAGEVADSMYWARSALEGVLNSYAATASAACLFNRGSFRAFIKAFFSR